MDNRKDFWGVALKEVLGIPSEEKIYKLGVLWGIFYEVLRYFIICSIDLFLLLVDAVLTHL